VHELSIATLHVYEKKSFNDCKRAPQNFFIQTNDANLWALDASFRSAHKDAPALDADLALALKSGKDKAFTVKPRGGGVMVQRIAQSGDCQVIVIDWSRSQDAIAAALARAITAITVTCLIVFLLTVFFIVKPLTQRISKLTERARAVGTDIYPARNSRQRDELDDIAQALDQAHEHIGENTRLLEERNRALQQHLSDIAHDLRTPITALQLKLERALSASLDAASVENVTRGALSDALYLESLCENLRFAATLREGLSVEKATCDLTHVAARIVSRLTPQAQLKNVELNVALGDHPIHIPVAQVVMERLLSNLIANAIVHQKTVHQKKRSGNVAIIVSQTQKRFTLQVQDDGRGLPEGVLARVRERSEQRTSARWSEKGGSGLGLQIVCELAFRCNMNIAFKNTSPGLVVEVSGDVLGSV